jgi:uncharacterized cofD-like protein
MHIKRWIGLAVLGLIITSLGFAYLLVQVYRVQPLPEAAATITLQFIERPVRGAIFLAIGFLCVVVAILKLQQSLLAAFVQPSNTSVVDTIYNYRSRQRGPRVVVIGGGTGLSVALRGLKGLTNNLTAIVTVADDGGSSGRLRRDLGILPPGDFRNCMVALADVEPLMEDLFQYRFDHGGELEGHSFGNLFIVAMREVTGSFERALEESSRVLAVRGRVLPSTLADVQLCAEMDDATTVCGESAITKSIRGVQRVFLQPDHPRAYPEAIQAIYDADLIVVGPGSLYTSVLPNLLVGGICDALMRARAFKVYVCNVATQPGETDDYSIGDHIEALRSHMPGRELPFHHVLANSLVGLPMPPSGKVLPVSANGLSRDLPEDTVLYADVVDVNNPVRHDSVKLAEALLKLYSEKGDTAAAPRKMLAHV